MVRAGQLVAGLSQRLLLLKKGVPDCETRCLACGGPDPFGKRVTWSSDSSCPLRPSEECNNPIDRDGKPLGPIDRDGKPLGEWRGWTQQVPG